MERSAFALLSHMERSWWYRGRAKVVQTLVRRVRRSHAKRILDFGAGSGGMFSMWREIGDEVYGFEPDAEAATEAASRGYVDVYTQEERVRTNTYDIIALCDVLEHIEDDEAALNRLHSMLERDGHILITVPAYQWLWGTHDVTHHHFRRYTKKSLRRVLQSAGFDIVIITYWNTALFLPALGMRLFGRTGEGALHVHHMLNALCLGLIHIEALCMRFIALPFGLSVAAIAQKKTP